MFLQILSLYIRVFKLLINKMFKRFWSQRFKSLKIALVKGMTVLDQLGYYCFIKAAKALVLSVLKPFKTVRSLKKGA
jgi:hypothetical protein